MILHAVCDVWLQDGTYSFIPPADNGCIQYGDCFSISKLIMAFTLWTLFEATLLCLNAVCVLHEERFLVKMGWGAQQNIQGFGESPTIKSQMLNLVRSIRTVARFPLIFLNILTIIVKLVLG